MKKYLIVLWILVSLLFSACRGAEQVEGSETIDQENETAATETTLQEEPTQEIVSTKNQPAEFPVQESGGSVSAVGMQMECTLVSDQPDAPAEFVEIFGVNEKDWIKGPDTAAVTFVEYGDFQ
jgi:hypothetical protein